MSDLNLSSIAAHPIGATPGIKPVLPSCAPQAHRCEMALHIGLFFDGTGNNQDWIEPGQSQSQLAGFASRKSSRKSSRTQPSRVRRR